MSEWVMVRKKREWVPERLWAFFCLIGLADTWPLVSILTEIPKQEEPTFDWNMERWRTDFLAEYATWRDAGFPEPPREVADEFGTMMRGGKRLS